MKIKLKKENSNDTSVVQNSPVLQKIDTPNENLEIARENLESRLNCSSKRELPKNLTIFADTEFNQSEGMQTLAIPFFCPELDAIHCVDKDELSEEFDLISHLLTKQGYSVGKINRIGLETKINELWKKKGYKSFTQKSLADFKKENLVLAEFKKLGIDIYNCEIEYSKKKKLLYVKFNKVNIQFQMFFAYADLFRIFGKDCQVIWYERAKLTQFRTIKIMGQVRITRLIDGLPVDAIISIFDNRYCLPPIKGSLDYQAKTFGADKYLEELALQTENSKIKDLIKKSKSKIKLSEEIEKLYGDKLTEQWCKENMHLVREKYPDVFADYAMMDALVTFGLNRALNGLLTEVCLLLEIEKPTLAETCGKNIENILLALIEKHFGITDDEDSIFDSKGLLSLIDLGRSETLAKIEGNQYGIVPSSVVGGLLYTRTSKVSLVLGKLFDLDEASCYATGLCSMNLYLGQPMHLTFAFDKPKLGRVFKLIQKHNISMDAWQLQVSGELKKAVNTLILSNSQFKNSETILQNSKRYAMPDDINLESENLNLIDADKSSEPSPLSKLLTKEINGGIITQATMTALSDLPEDWYQEFLNLDVDAIIYFHPSMMCDSIEEYLDRKANCDLQLFNNGLVEELTEDLQKVTKTQLSKVNLCLVFPIGKYYQKIKSLRKQMKKDGKAVQEIFKLILNSTYGILASLVMKVNNPVAANWITSCARAAAWRMTNCLNGLNPITDGTAVNEATIPFGKTFHEVLDKYSDYLEHYQPDISNNQSELIFTEDGSFNDAFIKHLEAFIGKSDWLTQMYAYDLKSEEKDGVKHFHYEKHYNTNAANYVKNGGHGDTFKCRSYRKNNELISWFKKSCEDNYTQHLIYADKSVIKLSQGSIDAMRILKDAENVANRSQKLVKMPSELAEKIAVDGICHPMGFSRYEVKVLKLISPSQFLCKDFRQMKILMALYEECKAISKTLLPGSDWTKKLSIKKIENEFPIHTSDGYIQKVDYREELDYAAYNRLNPVGLGLELLIWGNRDFKSLNDVRGKFAELIAEYQISDDFWDIRKQLHWQRLRENLTDNIYLKHFLASVVIAKLNYEIDYRNTLAKSVADPMSRVQFLGDITTLKYELSKKL